MFVLVILHGVYGRDLLLVDGRTIAKTRMREGGERSARQDALGASRE